MIKTKAIKKNKIGIIYPKSSMFLRTFIGKASEGKNKYELATNADGSPLVESKQTGNYFSIPWKSILELASKAGIDKVNLK